MLALFTEFYRHNNQNTMNCFTLKTVNNHNASTSALCSVDTHFDASTTAFEKIVGKGVFACYEQFLFFPQCFLFNQIIVSPFVHIFDVISLFDAQSEKPEIGISGKGLRTWALVRLEAQDSFMEVSFGKLHYSQTLVLVKPRIYNVDDYLNCQHCVTP